MSEPQKAHSLRIIYNRIVRRLINAQQSPTQPHPEAPMGVNRLPRITSDILDDIESAYAENRITNILAELRRLSLDDFSLVTLAAPLEAYPEISKTLPAMAAPDVQQSWTGSSGLPLLRQSVNFIRTVQQRSLEFTGASLSGKSILDYGCGYGRLLRLMLYYCDAEKLTGCDPWEKSINLCKKAGIACRLDVTDYLPERLPYNEASFDLIFSFSVFTHTSRRAAETALKALRPIIRPNGLLVLTIRPVEYWDHNKSIEAEKKEQLIRAHNAEGFAFRPHNRGAIDGDITYGDTSMTFGALAALAKGWKIVAYDRLLDDPYQAIVVLEPD